MKKKKKGRKKKKVSERDGSHTGEVVLCWVLVEQARDEHMSNELLFKEKSERA